MPSYALLEEWWEPQSHHQCSGCFWAKIIFSRKTEWKSLFSFGTCEAKSGPFRTKSQILELVVAAGPQILFKTRHSKMCFGKGRGQTHFDNSCCPFSLHYWGLQLTLGRSFLKSMHQNICPFHFFNTIWSLSLLSLFCTPKMVSTELLLYWHQHWTLDEQPWKNLILRNESESHSENIFVPHTFQFFTDQAKKRCLFFPQCSKM